MAARRFDADQLTPWIEVRFARSSGPGGQNVNKVNTRVTLLFDFEACGLLSAQDRALIRRCLAGRLARDGRLRVVCQQARSQLANRETAAQRLVEQITIATAVPKRRHATRPTAASRARRLNAKRRRGAIKQLRTKRPSLVED